MINLLPRAKSCSAPLAYEASWRFISPFSAFFFGFEYCSAFALRPNHVSASTRSKRDRFQSSEPTDRIPTSVVTCTCTSHNMCHR